VVAVLVSVSMSRVLVSPVLASLGSPRWARVRSWADLRDNTQKLPHMSSQQYGDKHHVIRPILTIAQLTTVPGQVMYNGAKIQILDLPGIIQGAKDGKGRGRQVIAVAKTCHLIFIVLDVNKPLTDKRVIENELEGFGIRINKSPPNIVLKKKDKGGINITSTVPLSHIDHDEIKAVLNEYRMANADVAIRCDATVDDLIDIIEAKCLPH
jgi:small GTP-binding protein